MLYKFIQYLISFSSWTASQWALAVVVALLIAGLAYTLPALLRLFLVPFLLLEGYFMSTVFACGGSLNMFSRAYGTQSACTQLDYSRYLGSNFGFEHWYVVAGYIGLAIFMIWPLFSKIAHINKRTQERHAEHKAYALEAVKDLDLTEKMKKMGRIGSI